MTDSRRSESTVDGWGNELWNVSLLPVGRPRRQAVDKLEVLKKDRGFVVASGARATVIELRGLAEEPVFPRSAA